MVTQNESNELYHHGVKGQHWGSRNGPPYPLYRKSAYYKKTGKRPPGYTGNKKGKSDSGGTNKSGRVGGLKDIKRAGDTSWVHKRNLRKLTGGRIGGLKEQLVAGTAFDKSEKGRKVYSDYQNYRKSVYLRGAAGLGLGAAAGAVGSALTKRDIRTGLAAGAALGSTAGSLSALPKYATAVKSMRARRREIRENDKRGKIGGLSDTKNIADTKNKESIKNKLLARYKKKALESGMSNAEANKYAKEKYESTIKTLKIAGGLVGAAAIATAAYKGGRYIKNEFMDETVKAGKKVQTLSLNPNRQADETFYGAHRLQDKLQYRGMANNLKGPTGWHASKDGTPPKVYRLNSVVTSDAKIASNRNSRKVFEELRRKDPEFKAYTDKLKYNFDNRGTKFRYIKNTDAYGAFNRDGLMYGMGDQKQNSKFFNAMKKRGYSGIKDINDRQLNTYQTDANIWFGNANNYKSKLKTLKTHDADYGNKAKAMMRFNKRRRVALTGLDRGGLAGAAAIGSGAGISYNSYKQRSKLRKYKRRKKR